jgi:alcohol dehydrogenase (cytochrome c)
MKTASLLGALLLCAACPASALAQSADDLKNDQQTPGDVLVYGMGYSGQRYSPLTRIDKSNVGQLVPKWAYSINDSHGAEAFPVVKDGVIYTTAHNMTAAVDALTGKQLWRTAHDYPPETLRVVCCGIVNRGVAIYNGMIIRLLLDNQIIAMDAKTGKVIWQVKSPEPATIQNGYAMTGAPLIANGVIIVGVAGAEFSIRGFLEGYDVATGKHLWRLYTVPAPGEKGIETWGGDSALTGGGSSWVTAATIRNWIWSTGASAIRRRGIRAPAAATISSPMRSSPSVPRPENASGTTRRHRRIRSITTRCRRLSLPRSMLRARRPRSSCRPTAAASSMCSTPRTAS